MADRFPPPVRRVAFCHPPEGGATVTWPQLRQVLCSWTVKGCAYIERDGHPLDIVTLAGIGAGAELGGATLVVMHHHLHAALPNTPIVWVSE
jgi:hypothetical protein